MLNTILKSAIALTLVAGMGGCALSTGTSSSQKRIGLTMHGVAGDQNDKFMEIVSDLDLTNFILTDPHAHINNIYEEKYGSTKLDNLGFFSIANDKALRTLLEKYPQIGGFSPFNLHIYKKKTEDMTWVGHINPEVMMDIVGVTDNSARTEFVSMFKGLDKQIIQHMEPTVTNDIIFTELPSEPMMTFEFDVEGNIEDYIEEFQEKFETLFEEKKYIIAGYKNVKEAYDDMEVAFSYDAYWVYSLCHFKFSNSIFNDKPIAGAFAPCSVYMYIKNNKMYVGMPKLQNWINIIGFKDPAKIKAIKDLDIDIAKTFIELSGKKTRG